MKREVEREVEQEIEQEIEQETGQEMRWEVVVCGMMTAPRLSNAMRDSVSPPRSSVCLVKHALTLRCVMMVDASSRASPILSAPSRVNYMANRLTTTVLLNWEKQEEALRKIIDEIYQPTDKHVKNICILAVMLHCDGASESPQYHDMEHTDTSS